MDNPALINFALPEDHVDTRRVLQLGAANGASSLRVGCAKWSRQELKNFYPRGVKDELAYYSSQFNSVELNATFYGNTSADRFSEWRQRAADDFVFFPKLPRAISHERLLKHVDHDVARFLQDASRLQEKLGTFFLQMPESFGPNTPGARDSLAGFIRSWPAGFSLAVELRHADWFGDQSVSDELCALFAECHVANVITDTAGRRDLLHMRLTTPDAFIRYVGANHESDYERLDDWVERIAAWTSMGISQIAFFVHQNHELESPLLARRLVERINSRLELGLRVPEVAKARQEELF